MSEAPQNSTQRMRRREVKELNRRRVWLNEAQMAMGWLIVLGLAALLGTIYLSQASRIANAGRTMQVLQNELETVKRENADLEREIADAQALDRLRAEAGNKGFVPADPEDIEFLVITDFPVKAAPTPAPKPTRMPIDTMEEALWLAVTSSLGNLGTGEANEP